GRPNPEERRVERQGSRQVADIQRDVELHHVRRARRRLIGDRFSSSYHGSFFSPVPLGGCQSRSTSSPPRGEMMAATSLREVSYLSKRTCPSQKRNCTPAASGEPQLSAASSSIVGESRSNWFPLRPVPPEPPRMIGSSQYQPPARIARVSIAFSAASAV